MKFTLFSELSNEVYWKLIKFFVNETNGQIYKQIDFSNLVLFFSFFFIDKSCNIRARRAFERDA